MSAWIMHLRIAEKLMKKGLVAEALPYYIGSVAPDSGTLIGSFHYEPPKSVTHWHNKLPDRLESNMLFYKEYIANEKDEYKRSFYVGYFVHILTDTFFVQGSVLPIIEANSEQWKKDPWSIKGDWFNDDYIFLENDPEFEPYKMLCRTVKFDNVFLDYFGREEILERVRGISEFYKTHKADRERENKYFSIEKAERFIDEVSEIIFGLFSKCDNILLAKK